MQYLYLNKIYKQDSNEIPTAIPMFSMLLLELSDVSGRRKSKMAATEPEILISQLLFGHSAFELLDSENVRVDVGISLLSRIQAEIYVISYKRPAIGRHLRFTTYPDIGQYSH